MRVHAIFVVVLAAAIGAIAQSRPESAPETQSGLEAMRPLMAKMRSGVADVETARLVVEGLLRSEHAIAAPWWLTLANEPAPDEKLAAAERETLARLRRACERPESFVEERKLILRVIRETESLVAGKDFEAARQARTVARGMLGLIPDANLARLLEAAEKKIPARKPGETNAPPKNVAWPGGLGADLTAAGRKLIDLGVLAYRDAGCRPGRYVLARSFREIAILLAPHESILALARLRGLVGQVEPNSSLRLIIRTIGTARLFREGESLVVTEGGAPLEAATHEPVEIPVLPGDTVTVALDEPYSFDAIGKSFVLGLNARFEARDLGVKHLFCDLGEKPGTPGAELLPLPLAKKKPNPPQTLFGQSREQDDALRAFNTYFELPMTKKRSVDVPCLGDMIGFGHEFELRKLAPVWIGTEADHFAVVIKVPEA